MFKVTVGGGHIVAASRKACSFSVLCQSSGVDDRQSFLLSFVLHHSSEFQRFLPRDAMLCGLCCGPVSVRLSVCMARSCVLYRRLNIRQTSLQPHHPSLLIPSAGTQFQGEPLRWVRKIEGEGKFLRCSTEIPVYLGRNVDRKSQVANRFVSIPMT